MNGDQFLFETCIKLLSEGISTNSGVMGLTDLLPGRFSSEKRATIFLKQKRERVNLMDIIFFAGVKPWYNPWIEIGYTFDINEDDNRLFSYFDSDIEQKLIHLFCNALPPAGKLFVSYDADDETQRGLMMNIPMVLSRLGFLMYMNGCTWFKDWYFPEGGVEGGQKLQGEKPLDTNHKKRHLCQLKEEVSNFILNKNNEPLLSSFEKKALKRGNIFLKKNSSD